MKHKGKYYFYFPADSQIGVAVSDSPSGPFSDPLGQPLIAQNEGGTRAIDPAVFVDDDERAYLYYGQNSLCVVELKEDMIHKNGEIKQLEVQNYHEGIWVHKYNEMYYLTYPSDKGDLTANLLEYSIGSTPFGPFEYKGVIMDNRSRNIHHSVVKVENQWCLFYHIQGSSPYERRVCAEYLYYNPDAIAKNKF